MPASPHQGNIMIRPGLVLLFASGDASFDTQDKVAAK
jgi:hypothetical protein